MFYLYLSTSRIVSEIVTSLRHACEKKTHVKKYIPEVLVGSGESRECVLVASEHQNSSTAFDQSIVQ